MTLIDANVILRFVLQDHTEMHRKAREVIAAGDCSTLPEIIAEVVYVLEKLYKAQKRDIRDTLVDLFDRVSINNPTVIIHALNLYAESNVDFVDGVLIARAVLLGDAVFSFDKKVQKLIERGRTGETL